MAISKMYESGKADFGIPSDSAPIEEIAMTEDELDLDLLAELKDAGQTE